VTLPSSAYLHMEGGRRTALSGSGTSKSRGGDGEGGHSKRALSCEDESVFSPTLSALDLMNLPNYSIYLRLMIDGTVSPPFSAVTLPEIREHQKK
jgi:hypothetical protein